MDDPHRPTMIPDGRVVLNGVIAHSDYDISGRQEFISRRVVQLAYSSSKILEEINRDSASSLERANYWQATLTEECANCVRIYRPAGE